MRWANIILGQLKVGEHQAKCGALSTSMTLLWVYSYIYHVSFNLARITTTLLSLPPKVHLRHIAGHAQAPLPLHLCFGLS